jgi:uncharacterized protein YutE (UPF0331/DUF86 family)
MTDLDAALVRRKLALIARNLDDLATVADLPLDAYVADRFRRKGTERLLQETVEAAVDINLHIARAEGAPASHDYYGSFVEAGRRGIIPPALAERLAPATGLRNRIVHEYDAIDDGIVLDAVSDAVRDFGEFVADVELWLASRGL